MILFFYKDTGTEVPKELDCFVRADGTVWRDSFETCESQCSVVGFDDFIIPCENIGWKLKEKSE